jgi:uncharacterized protein YigA (DUF484 family)
LSSGRPLNSLSSLGSRTANTSAIRSTTRRRATNASVWRRGAIEPLSIVDGAHQREILGELRQEAQDGQADQEAIRSVAGS